MIKICVPKRLSHQVYRLIPTGMLQTPDNKKWGWIISIHPVDKSQVKALLRRGGMRMVKSGNIWRVTDKKIPESPYSRLPGLIGYRAGSVRSYGCGCASCQSRRNRA